MEESFFFLILGFKFHTMCHRTGIWNFIVDIFWDSFVYTLFVKINTRIGF